MLLGLKTPLAAEYCARVEVADVSYLEIDDSEPRPDAEPRD